MSFMDTNSEDKEFLSTLAYRGSDGERVFIKHEYENQFRVNDRRSWFWRHPGSMKWHGPFINSYFDKESGDVHDLGKSRAMLDAAHAFGRSGAAVDWEPLL